MIAKRKALEQFNDFKNLFLVMITAAIITRITTVLAVFQLMASLTLENY